MPRPIKWWHVIREKDNVTLARALHEEQANKTARFFEEHGTPVRVSQKPGIMEKRTGSIPTGFSPVLS